MPEGRSQASADDIKVTPEMVDAGALREAFDCFFHPAFPRCGGILMTSAAHSGRSFRAIGRWSEPGMAEATGEAKEPRALFAEIRPRIERLRPAAAVLER
jgi:hypothetical protein